MAAAIVTTTLKPFNIFPQSKADLPYHKYQIPATCQNCLEVISTRYDSAKFQSMSLKNVSFKAIHIRKVQTISATINEIIGTLTLDSGSEGVSD